MNTKKNICLLYFDHMSGEFTSILDTYSLVKKQGFNEIDLLVLAEVNESLLILRKYLPKEFEINLNIEQPRVFEEYGSVICSAFYFYTLAQQQRLKNFFSCDKLIILDSSSFIMGELNNIPILKEIENFPCSEKYILGNPFNSKYFHKDFIEYYHKLDFERINQYSQIKRNETFQKKFKKDPLAYKDYNYFRQILVQFDQKKYYENIGKLIFEFQYLNRPVYYSIKNKTFKEDGLTFYLKLFDIDDTKDQILCIPKQKIEQKLGFQKDDLLLEILA